MIAKRPRAVLALALALAALSLAGPEPAAAQEANAAPTWSVDAAASRVGFVAEQSGDPVPGEFKSFDAEIRFGREHLDDSRVAVTIRIASVDAATAEQEQTVTSPSLFHAAKHPEARFVATDFQKLDEGRYLARGDLRMRGQTHPVELPFDLTVTRQDDRLRAVAEGAITVKRLRWGIGKGQWADTSTVPNEVRIEIRIVAHRPAA